MMSAMVCPVCEGSFNQSTREGIIIDSCVQCRGVWLDRGELEKLLGAMRQEVEQEMRGVAANFVPQPQSHAPIAPYPPQAYQQPQAFAPQQGYQQPRHHKYDDDDHYKHSYKKSKIARLFDIFD
jgi:uncharacterized protein